MVRRTYERAAVFIEKACDLEDLVKDKSYQKTKKIQEKTY